MHITDSGSPYGAIPAPQYDQYGGRRKLPEHTRVNVTKLTCQVQLLLRQAILRLTVRHVQTVPVYLEDYLDHLQVTAGQGDERPASWKCF